MAGKTKRKVKTTKWYYMSDTRGKVKLVGLYPVTKKRTTKKKRK